MLFRSAFGAERRRWSLDISLRRVSTLDLALVTRQLSTLIGAGIPLVTALSALTEQVETSRLKGLVAGVRDRVNEGATLADALAQAGPFSELYVGMVRAGETGGALEQVLARLADYLESQVRLRNKVGSILIYPVVMFGFALLVVAALVTVVLPQITQLLATLNHAHIGTIYGLDEHKGAQFIAMELVEGQTLEEKLKAEFSGVKRTFVPLHAVVRIDEVEREGVNKIEIGRAHV